MADPASAAQRLVDSAAEMPEQFADVATHDPISAVLLALGTLFVVLPVAVLGYLSVGAFFSLFTIESAPPQSGRHR